MFKMDSNVMYRNGLNARILCVDSPDETFPIVTIDDSGYLHTHTTSGRIIGDAVEHGFDLIIKTKYHDFKDGDMVMVCHYNSWVRRYFAYEKDGKAYCYEDGATKWSSQGNTTQWNNCRKATHEEIYG